MDLSKIGTRDRGGWRKSSLAFLERVKGVIDGFREYWPLTLRQVFYQLVAALIIKNTRGAYKSLSRFLVKARMDEMVPWEAIEDRSRVFHEARGWPDHRDFIQDEADDFLHGYRRHLLQSQEHELEVWIEKDALAHIVHTVAFPYCVPVAVGKGFTSASYVDKCRTRILRNVEEGRKTRVLYFGDLDPSGWFMLEDMLKTLAGEMDLAEHLEAVRVALLPEQVRQYHLPRDPEAFKEKDPRGPKYRELHGDLAVELDALPPPELQALVKEAIEENLDLSKLERERRIERLDWVKIEALRSRALAEVEGFLDGSR